MNENGPLPVDVRRSNTPLLKLPRRGGAGEEYEYTTEIQASFKRIKRDPLSGMLLSSLALNMVLVVGWFGNRTGTSFDDEKARGKD